MSEHQSQEPHPTPQAPGLPTGARASATSRRSLLRGGLVGAPTLLALKPASVIACSCKLPSGFTVSGNASRGLKNCADPAEKPSAWKTRTKNVGGNNCYYSGSTTLTIHKLTTVSSLGFTPGTYGSSTTTIDDWITANNLGDTSLIMACYLEACIIGNDTTFPKKDKFVSMWNAAVVSTAGYTVANQGGVKWNKAQVLGYLKFLTNQAT